MAIYLISYDLGVPETSMDYKKVINYIKSLGPWAKPLYSLFLVQTNLSITSIRDNLKGLVDRNDKILVMDVSQDNWAAYNLADEVADWMKQKL